MSSKCCANRSKRVSSPNYGAHIADVVALAALAERMQTATDS
jgi:hypothetical protein